MLKEIGTSCFMLLMALASLAQVPHPLDTLPNGKKVAFEPFLGRVSLYNEILGAAFYPSSLNVAYTFIKRESWLMEYAVGVSMFPDPWNVGTLQRYTFPTGLSFQLGRRRSRLNVKLGYNLIYHPGYEQSPWPNCGGLCPEPPQHLAYFSLGYVFQHHHGFFFGVNAYGMVSLNAKTTRVSPFKDIVFPWAGLTLGYRIPSTQQLVTWKDMRRGRVSRSRDGKADDAGLKNQHWTEEAQEPTAEELAALAEEMAARNAKQLRMQQRDLRDNGPSNVFIEALGAGFTWSVNYQYTAPVKPKSLVHAYGRAGVGGAANRAFGSPAVLTIPIGAGIQLLRQYRGGGIGAGLTPTLHRSKGMVLVSYLSLEAHFHIAHGVTFGAGYQVMFDPENVHGRNQVFQWGGFSVGYRPQRKKK